MPDSHVLPAVDHRTGMLYDGELAEGWDINGVPNGGYSGVFGVLAMLAATDKPDPLTITAHYLRPTHAGPIEIQIAPVREGRMVSTLQAHMVQDGKEVIRLTGSFGDLDALGGPTTMTIRPPELPPVDECPQPTAQDLVGAPPFFDKVDMRRPEGSVRVFGGAEAQPAEVTGWVRHRGDHETAIGDLFLFADAFPPPIFQTGYGPSWVPTIELTVHFRARPTTPWVAARFISPSIHGGLQTEDGDLWDANGTLLAQSRQLALALPAGG